MYFVVAAVSLMFVHGNNKILSVLLKNWGVKSFCSILYFCCNFLNFCHNDLKFWHKINIIFFELIAKVH